MLEPPRMELSAIGIGHTTDSFSVAPFGEAKGPRRYGLMIAARFPLVPSPTGVSVCWPERMLSADMDTPAGPMLLHTTHIPPGSSNGETKILVIEGVLGVVAAAHPAASFSAATSTCRRRRRSKGVSSPGRSVLD